jgi:hypothetical protein
MKQLLLAAVLLITGCATIDSVDTDVDYSQVDTAYPALLLPPPPAVSNEALPEGTYYRDENEAYLAELDAYIAYLKRHRNAIKPQHVTVIKPLTIQCATGFVPPQRSQMPVIKKVNNIADDREVIMAMKYYILDLKTHILDYDVAVNKAYREWQQNCTR